MISSPYHLGDYIGATIWYTGTKYILAMVIKFIGMARSRMSLETICKQVPLLETAALYKESSINLIENKEKS